MNLPSPQQNSPRASRHAAGEPFDAVYLWVDGAESKFRESLCRYPPQKDSGLEAFPGCRFRQPGKP
jgi:hypothetical protein